MIAWNWSKFNRLPRRAMLFRRLPLIAALLAGASLPARPARAGGFTDPVEIDRAVAAFTGAPIGVPGGAQLPVDRRLRLVQCTAPLALSWRNGGHDSVVVQCPEAGGWRIFVAVAQQQQADTTPAVARGDAVTIAATGDGFSVSQPGEALDAGAVGAWIRVRTNAKADPMRAQIVRPGLVQLPVE
ncbi:flagella basal body P-ring formation protein FlgA [Novosphingobium huizhouense]|uniref:flagella basal body P-ring formation protein FlgA n=1 Tax=Novosphingobium huizhouense TaxID=2866625 RepID=UPI001CD8F6FD|nr:flagella basal body P-ring formation protein FlgA [Novosphingobium huizhouense]